MTARRITICLHDFTRGGTEHVAIALAGLWAGAGREVTILCGNEGGGLRDLVDPRVKVAVLDPPIHRSLLSRFRLGRAMGARLAGLRPDVIFLPGNFHALLAPALRKAAPDAVIALKISNPPLPHGPLGFLLRPFFRLATRGVDGFAAMNSGLAREVRTLQPHAAIATLHDPVRLDEGAAMARSGGPRRILWAGRLEPQKDVMLALEVIAALNRACPAHLTILGDGSARDMTDAAIRKMGLQHQVTRLGHVAGIAPYFAHADALLITSRYEGGPAVAVEALAHGVPVVSTDCSHLLRDILTVPEAGKVVESRAAGDLAVALFAVLQQPRGPREKLAALVAGFAPGPCARAYLDWFDGLRHDR